MRNKYKAKLSTYQPPPRDELFESFLTGSPALSAEELVAEAFAHLVRIDSFKRKPKEQK